MAGAGGSAEKEEVTRDNVRRELEEKMHAFMPQEHEFREASRGSVPTPAIGSSRTSPGCGLARATMAHALLQRRRAPTSQHATKGRA